MIDGLGSEMMPIKKCGQRCRLLQRPFWPVGTLGIGREAGRSSLARPASFGIGECRTDVLLSGLGTVNAGKTAAPRARLSFASLDDQGAGSYLAASVHPRASQQSSPKKL